MQTILGMYFPQANTCPLVVTYYNGLLQGKNKQNGP